MEPTLHKPVPMETRVRYAGTDHVGTIVGVASMHVVFMYIVLLDTPIDSPEGRVRAIVAGGPQLESEDGLTHWRLEPHERVEQATRGDAR